MESMEWQIYRPFARLIVATNISSMLAKSMFIAGLEVGFTLPCRAQPHPWRHYHAEPKSSPTQPGRILSCGTSKKRRPAIGESRLFAIWFHPDPGKKTSNMNTTGTAVSERVGWVSP